VVGITVSRRQAELGRERCRGLPVDIRVMDYRDLPAQVGGCFERVASVGMLEHVGVRNYRGYFDIARRMLADDGLFLLHTIGNSRTVPITDPWQIALLGAESLADRRVGLEQGLEGPLAPHPIAHRRLGLDALLQKRLELFTQPIHLPGASYDDVFYRMWKYYLHASAGFFRSRQGQVWQLVLAKRGRPGVYRSMR